MAYEDSVFGRMGWPAGTPRETATGISSCGMSRRCDRVQPTDEEDQTPITPGGSAEFLVDWSKRMSRSHRTRRVIISLAAGGAVLALSASPAAAIPPGWTVAPGGANSNGAGFCLSQVAQDPQGTAGTSSLGALVREFATSGSGAVPSAIADVRYPLCGGPGSEE